MRLLLIEDDQMIGESLQKMLRQDSYAVDWVKDGQEALIAWEANTYGLVLLDLGLPSLSGLELLKKFRQNSDPIPILILTARDRVDDRVEALDYGADDYLIKPFDYKELSARVRALIRRHKGRAEPILSYAGIELNPVTHELTYKSKTSILSAREFSLMQALLENPSAILSRSQIEEKVYGWNEEVESNAIEVHIYNLRQRLGKGVIHNIRGVGYTVMKSS